MNNGHVNYLYNRRNTIDTRVLARRLQRAVRADPRHSMRRRRVQTSGAAARDGFSAKIMVPSFDTPGIFGSRCSQVVLTNAHLQGDTNARGRCTTVLSVPDPLQTEARRSLRARFGCCMDQAQVELKGKVSASWRIALSKLGSLFKALYFVLSILRPVLSNSSFIAHPHPTKIPRIFASALGPLHSDSGT